MKNPSLTFNKERDWFLNTLFFKYHLHNHSVFYHSKFKRFAVAKTFFSIAKAVGNINGVIFAFFLSTLFNRRFGRNVHRCRPVFV